LLAKNETNVGMSLDVSILKKEGSGEFTSDGSGTIINYSQLTSVKNIGNLDPGTYTYKIQYGEEDVCTATATVIAEGSNVTADCEFKSNGSTVTSTTTGNTGLQFLVTNIVGDEQKANREFVLKMDGSAVTTFTGNIGISTSPGGAGIYNNFAAPNVAGSYTYTVEYSGNQICSVALTVTQAFSCAVSTESPTSGSSFTFTASSDLNCHSCRLYNDESVVSISYNSDWGLPSNGESSKTWDLTSTGNAQHIRATCTCDNVAVSCDKWVNFTLSAPEITCPDAMQKRTGGSVSITPKAVVGCDTGCSYKIEEAASGGDVIVNHTAKDYKNNSGKMQSFTGPTTEKTVRYRVTIFNEYNTQDDDDCTVDVTYTNGYSSCHCEDYCGTGCESNVITGNNNGSFTGCLFFTSASRINLNGNEAWTINGWHDSGDVNPGNDPDGSCYNGTTDCDDYLSRKGLNRVDGGYYFHGNNIWAELQTSATSNPCE
jgi:hypothetical protein